MTEFSFARDTDLAATLAAMLTAAVRPSLAHAPMFHARAHMVGSGKSYLCELITALATPQRGTPTTFPGDDEECRKLLLAELLRAPAVIEFDNLTGDLVAHKSLCTVLTSEHMSGASWACRRRPRSTPALVPVQRQQCGAGAGHAVREWVKHGLATSDDRRPMLILGRDLVTFLQAKRVKNKWPCLPGEIYCVRCRAARKPAGEMADYQPLTATSGNLVGMCPCCESMMYRRVNFAKLVQVSANLDVTLPHALLRIGESHNPCVNSDLRQGAAT